jgi:release factor glutamine methyltransferase
VSKGREPLTIKQELEWAVPFLNANHIENPRLEAEVLMAKVLGWERIKVLTHLFDPISETASLGFRNLIQKRATGFPLQYLTGKQEFMSLDFLVTPQVLIPRDDTEVVVETVLNLKALVKPCPAIVDLGTGSGIIAVTLKKHWPQAKVFAVDISSEALAIAKNNAQRHQTEIAFFQGDLLAPFKGKNTFDIIVSNPPYIPRDQIKALQIEVTKEPSLALDGGLDGLDYYHRLAQTAPRYLVQGGWLVVEIGSDQGPDVKAIFEENRFSQVKIVKDYAGRNRVVFGVKS